MIKLETMLWCLLIFIQDMPGANKMLKKHKAQEKNIEDFATTIQELSKTMKSLVEAQHPER